MDMAEVILAPSWSPTPGPNPTPTVVPHECMDEGEGPAPLVPAPRRPSSPRSFRVFHQRPARVPHVPHYDPDDLVRAYLRAHERRTLDGTHAAQGYTGYRELQGYREQWEHTAAWGCAV